MSTLSGADLYAVGWRSHGRCRAREEVLLESVHGKEKRHHQGGHEQGEQNHRTSRGMVGLWSRWCRFSGWGRMT